MKNLIKSFFLLCTVFFISSCVSKDKKLPALIEITDQGYRISNRSFLLFCEENLKDTSHIFQWENHHLIYVNENEVDEIKEKLETTFPDAILKVYSKPMYEFSQKKNCGNQLVKKCTDIIFTANLVADTIKQKEYMNYHARQIQDWPEVAQGFCRADFQQLLVYRSGRQLMLIISIPADKTLDELNPKTVDNNPQMIEWNKRMATYQEGIDQAPEGVVWVQFEKISVK